MVDEIIVETKELVKVYGDGTQVRALDGVDLSIRKGEFISVMGPSGSGKSTLLNMLGALDTPTSGQVVVDGQDLATIEDPDTFRARTVGFVFQLHNLIPTLTAHDNIEVPMIGQPVSRKERRKRAAELLTLVGLADRMEHLPNQLSGGERQRVAIARALANHPTLLLGDEPTGNLDTHSGAEVTTLMHKLNQELGTTFVIVTHDPAVARKTNRILLMRDGKIVHERLVSTPFAEDLATFRRSELGKALATGDKSALAELGPDEQAALKQMLGGLGRV